MKSYYRHALFDLTKNQFKDESDLISMSRFYTFALFNLKNHATVAPETRDVIERLVSQNTDQQLTMMYMRY